MNDRFGAGDAAAEDVALLDVLLILIRARRGLVRAAVGAAVLVAAVTLVLRRQYTVGVQFMAQSSGGTGSRIAGLAAQFGVAIPTGDEGLSPDFYADLVTSRTVLGPLAERRFALAGGDSLALASALGVTDADTALQRAKAVDRLRDVVGARSDLATGVVSFSVRLKDPVLSAGVAQAILDGVVDFNLRTRQSAAAAERRFVEDRLDSAAAELRAAENLLQSFLQSNRQFQSSPSLQFTYERLQRAVATRQDVYTSLAQSYEQARIAEVRDTPPITLVLPPEVPPRPDRRYLVLKSALAGFVALTLGAMLVVLRGLGGPRRGEDALALRAEWRETMREARRPWVWLIPQ